MALSWQRPLDAWLAENGCTRQTCFVTATYEDVETGEPAAPDSYLFLASFPNVTNLAKANVQVYFRTVIDQHIFDT